MERADGREQVEVGELQEVVRPVNGVPSLQEEEFSEERLTRLPRRGTLPRLQTPRRRRLLHRCQLPVSQGVH